MKPESKERGKPRKKWEARAGTASPKESPKYYALVRGYMGFLTGTGKSLSTISSYRGDLDLFEKFLREKKRDFYRLVPRDFETYQIWLEKNGLKTNTRRRKILSAKALVKYAVSRKKLSPSAVRFVKTPDRLERLPWIPGPAEMETVLRTVEEQSTSRTQTGLRNSIVVRVLLETGLAVAELCALRWDQWQGDKLQIEAGRHPRSLQVSQELRTKLDAWRTVNPGKHLFPGFNRHGITSEKMTPRGVELFFRQLARSTGLRALKPKTMRHFCVVEWLRAGVSDPEIHRRLGVHPSYSLAPYKKVLARDQAL